MQHASLIGVPFEGQDLRDYRSGKTLFTISLARSSVFASATILIIGSVFEPRTNNHPSGFMTLTPSRVSSGNFANSCRTLLSTPAMRSEGQAIFSFTTV